MEFLYGSSKLTFFIWQHVVIMWSWEGFKVKKFSALKCYFIQTLTVIRIPQTPKGGYMWGKNTKLIQYLDVRYET